MKQCLNTKHPQILLTQVLKQEAHERSRAVLQSTDNIITEDSLRNTGSIPLSSADE